MRHTYRAFLYAKDERTEVRKGEGWGETEEPLLTIEYRALPTIAEQGVMYHRRTV